MASKKKLLQAAAGSAGGAAGLDVDEVFSTYLYDGTGAAQVIENGIALGNPNDGGSARFDSTTSRLDIASSTDFNLGTGDFTIDFSAWWADGSQYQTVFSRGYSAGMLYQLMTDGTSTMYVNGGGFITDSTARAAGNWYQYCITRESGTVKLYVNGTLATTTTGTDNITSSDALNIGDDDSGTGYGINGGKQGFISNFRIIKGSVVTPPSGGYTSDLTAVSGTVLLTCQGDTPFVDNSSSSHSITKVNTVTASEFGPFTGSSGEGGLVWIKRRDSTEHNDLYDTVRGATKDLRTNATSAQGTESNGLQAFNSNGFTVGGDGLVGVNGGDYVSWTFRKAPKFFDVVTYTGDGNADRQINHNLGSVPGMMIVKKYAGSTTRWSVYHRSLGTGKFLNLDDTAAAVTQSDHWQTAPTATQFTVETNGNVNNNGDSYVAYLFAHNDSGDGEFGPSSDQDIIKCGSYTHPNNTSTVSVNLGFEPQWILFKADQATVNWYIFDVMRGIVTGGLSGDGDAALFPNTSGAENVNTFGIDVTSTGFDVAGYNIASSGNNVIYMAIRRGPLAPPESATDVFGVNERLGGYPTPTLINTGNVVDLLIGKRAESSGGGETYFWDRLRGGTRYLQGDSTAAETGSTEYIEFDTNEGFREGFFNTSHTQIHWTWKRAPSYFDVCCYSGTGSARTVNHNLGVAPEMIWVKKRSAGDDWFVYVESLGNTNKLELNSTSASGGAAVGGNQLWNSTTPTSSVFSVSDNPRVNDSGETYIAYLFASSNVSKVGSYTGTGSDQTIDCGFTNGARFVLAKRSSTSGIWGVFDTARGIVAGNDPLLRLNATNAESSSDYIDPHSSGFTWPGEGGGFNTSGITYIFYAIA